MNDNKRDTISIFTDGNPAVFNCTMFSVEDGQREGIEENLCGALELDFVFVKIPFGF